jgi:hypothetical protein
MRAVTSRVAGRTWAVWLPVAVILLLVTVARAQSPLAAGTKTLGLGGAISISHDTREVFDTVTGLELLPHVGYVLTEPLGPDWVRGNLQVLVEPILLHLESDQGSSTVVGASALARWLLSGIGRFRPYLEAGAGVLVGEMTLPQTDCDVNFLLQGGPGFLVFLSDTTSLAVAYRFQHISNGRTCRINASINSSALFLGVSYFFR